MLIGFMFSWLYIFRGLSYQDFVFPRVLRSYSIILRYITYFSMVYVFKLFSAPSVPRVLYNSGLSVSVYKVLYQCFLDHVILCFQVL